MCKNCDCKKKVVSQDEIEKKIMNSRKWIEFGKMMNNMETEGWLVDLGSCVHEDDSTAYYVVVSKNRTDLNIDYIDYNELCDDEEVFGNPYDAMKHMYFKYYHEIPDYDDVQFDLSDELLADLYKISDKEGITLDEVMIRLGYFLNQQ